MNVKLYNGGKLVREIEGCQVRPIYYGFTEIVTQESNISGGVWPVADKTGFVPQIRTTTNLTAVTEEEYKKEFFNYGGTHYNITLFDNGVVIQEWKDVNGYAYLGGEDVIGFKCGDKFITVSGKVLIEEIPK